MTASRIRTKYGLRLAIASVRLKPLVFALVSLGALFLPSAAFATQIAFSTAENTALLYTLTPANLATYDPGGAFGIYDDTLCDTGTIATQHGGTATMDGGSPDTIDYHPPHNFIGTDTVTFFNTMDGVNCTAQQAIATVTGPPAVSSLSPASGPLAGSTSVLIGGTGFTTVTAVRFGSSNATSYSVNSSTQITATSPAHAAGTVDVTVVNTTGTSATVTSDHYTYVAALAISTSTLPTPVYSVAYNQTIGTTGGTAPITFSISSGSLPAGLSLSATGTISGSPTGSGTYSFTVRATDNNALSASQAFSGTIAAPVSITTATLPTPVFDVSYSSAVATSGGTTPIVFSVSSGTLPVGLSLSSASGLISGTSTVAGAYAFTIRATDANAISASQAYSGTIGAGLAITTATLPTPIYAGAYNNSVVTSGGTAPIAFSISAGALPQGLSLSASGAISGTPTFAGAYTFTILASDANSITASHVYSGTIAAPNVSIAPSTLPAPLVGVLYSRQLVATGGLAPYTYSISAGTLPAGLSLNAGSGSITGTPSAAGAYTFTVAATDSGNALPGSQAYSGTIAASLAITTATLPTPVLGVAYNSALVTSGGTAPIAFSVSAGTLPQGLSLNGTTGALAGTPTAAGAYGFTILATDANSVTASQAYSGTIAADLAITTTTLPTPVLGVAYNNSLVTSGGTAPIAFSITAGTLPQGLSLNGTTGALAGTPTAAGAYSFTIRATDANSFTASHAYSGTIAAGVSIATSTLPTPAIGVAYSGHVVAAGGTAPYTFSLSAGTLPPGLTLNAASGYVTGTPTAPGTYAFTVRATDSNALSASQAYAGTIGAALAITTATLPTPVLGVAYNASIVTSGGATPIAFSLSAGTLPQGLSLNGATGALTGTPTAAGAYSLTILAADANSITASHVYSGTIAAGVSIATSTLPTPVIGVAYSGQVVAAGGTAPYTFSLSGGTLPTGLTLNAASGYVTGTATATGAYSFTIRATDSNALSASQAYSGTIGAALAITTATLPAPVLGIAYNNSIVTSGGTAPIAFSISAGTLPQGLSLGGATGALTGTPSVAGAYTFTILATDANAITASHVYSGTIAAGVSIATATLPTPVLGIAYSQSIVASGGTAPYTFSLSAGTLPTGLTLNSSAGSVVGTPTAAGAYSFTVRATDKNALSASQVYSGSIAAVPTVSALSTNAGPTAGGTTLTITGSAFTGATSVLFGTTPAASFTVDSATSLTVTSPPGTGSAPIRVVASGGTSTASAAATFTWASQPAVTGISPDQGSLAGGTVVKITGRAFTGATAVYFGTVAAATFTVDSDTSIHATTAAATTSLGQAAGVRKRPDAAAPPAGIAVTVVTAGGTTPATPASMFVYVPAVVPVPTIARLTPASGTSAGGTRVTITGTALGGTTAVRFGSANAAFSVVNSTTLSAVAPAGSASVNVTVTTPAGTSANLVSYRYVAAATNAVVTSSSNPAAARTSVTFTATVTSAGATPSGRVTFFDGATPLGTVALAGGHAALSTSALGIGTHAITVAYGGGARFAPSTSAVLSQSISVPADSVNLRALQLAATKLVAQTSGQAISSAIDDAIGEGFSGNAPLITPSATGMKFNLAQGAAHANAPGNSGDPGTRSPADKPRAWLVWGDLSTTGIQHTSASDRTTIYGHQVDALAGITRRLSPKIVAGVFGGYETFDYRSDALAGRLTGNGTTAGAYLGWKFLPGLRFDVAGAYSGVAYNGVAGTAYATFPGSRWLASSGLIGTYEAKNFAIEPSAKVYALWERQSGYTDSLGTPQVQSTFSTGRTSAGAKISTLPKSENYIAPYVGLYADYYFNADEAALAAPVDTVPLASQRILTGWSASAVAGFAAKFGTATTLTCGIDYGGIGSGTRIVRYHCGASVPLFRSKRSAAERDGGPLHP